MFIVLARVPFSQFSGETKKRNNNKNVKKRFFAEINDYIDENGTFFLAAWFFFVRARPISKILDYKQTIYFTRP